MSSIDRANPPARDRNAAPAARRAGTRFSEALHAARRAAGSRTAAASAGPSVRRVVPAATSRREQAALASREEETTRAAAGDAAQQRSTDVQAIASVDTLRAAVRALPAAVEAARVAGGGHVALAFGSALGVDLRGGAAGLELTLRPAAALEHAARAELPGLVAALRARGIRVARATVLSRGQGPRTGSRLAAARVDAAPGLG